VFSSRPKFLRFRENTFRPEKLSNIIVYSFIGSMEGETNKQFREQNELLRRENELLKAKIRELEARLAQYENAHTPPSLRRVVIGKEIKITRESWSKDGA